MIFITVLLGTTRYGRAKLALHERQNAGHRRTHTGTHAYKHARTAIHLKQHQDRLIVLRTAFVVVIGLYKEPRDLCARYVYRCTSRAGGQMMVHATAHSDIALRHLYSCECIKMLLEDHCTSRCLACGTALVAPLLPAAAIFRHSCLL